jgi:hypothetical protein
MPQKSKKSKHPAKRTPEATTTVNIDLPPPQVFTHLLDSHEFYGLVGRVASEWSHLEHTLDNIIWILASFRVGALGANIVACITSQIMGVGPRCKAIASLAAAYNIHNKALRDQINRVKGKSYDLADDRARIVHDGWWMETETKTPAQFRAMPASDPDYGFKDISKEQIEKTITDIKKLQHEAAILRQLVRDELEALRQRLA